MWFEFKNDTKTIQFEAIETGETFNYSDLSSGTYHVEWAHDAEHNKWYSTLNGWLSKNQLPSGHNLRGIIFNFSGQNVITMQKGDNFYGNSSLHTFQNGMDFSAGGSSKIKVSWYTWAEYVGTELVYHIVNGGIYAISPTGSAPFYSPTIYPYSSYQNTGFVWNDDYIPKMSFWIATMYDDVSGSSTYGQNFDVLIIAMNETRQGGNTNTEAFTVIDLRLLNGAHNLTPSKSTTRGNSPTGWTGRRNDHSDSDTESHIGTALRMANTTTYGLHFYRLQQQHLEWFQECLWGNDFWDNARMSQWNPIRGIISLHNLPVSLTVGNETTITVCGKKCQTSTMHHGTTNCLAFPVNDDKWEGTSSVFHPLEYSGSFLDWSTYTRAKLRLPFIGVVPIDVNLIMQGGGVYVKYNIDCITGNCLAQIYVKPQLMGDEGDGTCLMMIAQYSGNCAYKHTISTSDFGGGTALGSIISGVANVGIAAIAAFSGHPAAAGAAGIGAVKNLLSSKVSSQYSNEVQQATPNVDCMGMLVAALILERPIDITPLDENGDATVRKFFDGIPAASGGKVKDYKTGINQDVFIQGKIHADTLYATEREKKEIEDAFAKGVYI